ncbi:PREDICTED: uncharacterized protein LOC105136430 [Populus euphratica]|uniref:Uncharacterized protein LOC105136430 n=1 Tax=Populus euphratica TaxID=75702 RepID=A0AAJ6V2Z9_POPEU|nr:PREDICTED: uncharacterized protein LOC105136430 [Populus euphratica]
MAPKFDNVVCAIEESNNVEAMSIIELQSSLLVHEQHMNYHIVLEEHILKVTYEDHSRGIGRGHGVFRGRGRGRIRPSFDKSTVECYNCHEPGHFQYECPKKRLGANFVDTRRKSFFCDLDENFRETVKLGNNSSITVIEKGNVRIKVNENIQVITGVFYVPDLKSNLLSIGQLQEKGLAILIQHGKCKVYHPN